MSPLDSLSIVGKTLLVILTVLSFQPQFQRLQECGESTGISLFYVLFNLIVATEQFLVGLFLIIFGIGDPSIGHWPPLVREWLDLIQFGTVWLCHLVLFLYCLYLPPSSRAGEKFVVVALYLLFFAISLGAAVVLLVVLVSTSTSRDTEWLPVIFAGAHLWFINPAVTAISIFSLLAQACQMGLTTSRSAMSTHSLLAQSVLFSVIGVSWIFRLTPSDWIYDWRNSWADWNRWFELVGWAVFDNLIFAFVQAAIFCIAWGRRDEVTAVNERTGLLAHG